MQASVLDTFLEKHKLPEDYKLIVEQWYRPLANGLVKHHNGAKKPLIVGLNGAQGSGKSTLADLLVHLFESEHQLSAISLSIDDLYLTREQRSVLAENVHPLFATRGVAGTHDLQLAFKTFDSLLAGKPTYIPRFNKAIDDRFDEDDWDLIDKPVDIIVFEGWCLGAEGQSYSQLLQPVNELEAEEDVSLAWRSYMNQQLLNHYPKLFDYVDQWVMLKAPSFECVYNWRLEQENKLREKVAKEASGSKTKVMTDEQVGRFIKFYQRTTQELLQTLPAKVNYLFELDHYRQVVSYQAQQPQSEALPLSQPVLIFTDMDGSLLNHDDYDFSAALPLLEKLKQSSVPVIPCTSKTSAELLSLRVKLDNHHPFIVENGAAVFIPVGTFLQQPEDTVLKGNFWMKAFTQNRAHWISVLDSVSEKYQGCYTSFSQMSLAEIIDATGLDELSAQESSLRDFGEPVLWLDSNERKQQFINDLTAKGATILQGGRFIHVCGNADKGQALKWLADCYQSQQHDQQTYKTIAIGDSQNDVAMLETADTALLIPSPSHSLPNLIRSNNVFIADAVAPLGWKRGVENILNNYK